MINESNPTPTLTTLDFEFIDAIDEMMRCAFAVQEGEDEDDPNVRDDLNDALSAIDALATPTHNPTLNARLRAIGSDMREFIDAAIGD